MSSETTHAPSQSTEAERAVLGSVLTSPSLLPDVSTVLTVEDFFRGQHQDIFETIQRLAEEGHPTDSTAVLVALQRRGMIERIGGAAYLGVLAEHGDPAHALYYAQMVREHSIERRLQAFHAAGLQQIGDREDKDLEALLDATQTALDAVADERSSNDVSRVDDALVATLDYIEELGQRDGGITGVPTGFIDLDELTAGFQPGQMIVVAARPAVGKSTLGMDFLRSASIAHGKTSVLFSLEMGKAEVTMRLLSAEGRIPLQRLRTGRLEESDWARVGQKMGAISAAPLFIDDTANLTMSEIRSKARRIKQRHGLDLIVIDYLQLMTGDAKAQSREQEVSQMSRAVKLLAKELGVPIVVMSQLNRGPEQRADKKPGVSDLRESGAIEQDADMIILLHREEIGDPNTARVGECDLIVGKHRNGATATITVAAQLHVSRFVDMQREA